MRKPPIDQSFHPFVESADKLSEADRGIGASRQCNLYNKSTVVEKVIEWDEGRSFTVLTGETPISKETTGSMSVKPIGAHTSEVTVDANYTPKWGFLGKILDFLIMRAGVSYVLKRVLKSSELFLMALLGCSNLCGNS